MSAIAWTRLPRMDAPVERQMAIDATLAEWCSSGHLDAVVRFYRMTPPAVTIGRHQRYQTVLNEDLLQRRGWEWSRRVTGGGALLHRHELNYAIALSKPALSDFGEFGFQTAFRMIMSGLNNGLELLGCRPTLCLGGEGREGGPAPPAHGLCERSLTRHEISVDGLKAVAAAQLMTPEGCLQHGTIYLEAPQPTDRFWPEGGGIEQESSRWWSALPLLGSCADHVASLEDLLATGLSQHLKVRLEERQLGADFDTAVESRMALWTREGYHRRR